MKYNKKYFAELHDAKIPELIEDQRKLETDIDFKFGKGIMDPF